MNGKATKTRGQIAYETMLARMPKTLGWEPNSPEVQAALDEHDAWENISQGARDDWEAVAREVLKCAGCGCDLPDARCEMCC